MWHSIKPKSVGKYVQLDKDLDKTENLATVMPIVPVYPLARIPVVPMPIIEKPKISLGTLPTHIGSHLLKTSQLKLPDGGYQMLILDNQVNRSHLLQGCLEKLNIRGVQVSTGQQVIDYMEKNVIHGILLVSMDDGSIRAFLDWLQPKYPHLALIALAEDEEHSTDLYITGADMVTVSPFSSDLLASQIWAALRAKSALQVTKDSHGD